MFKAGIVVLRRRLASAAVIVGVLSVSAIVLSVPLKSWTDGTRLTSADLNNNFNALNTGKLEVGNIQRVSVEFPDANRPAGAGGIGTAGASCPGSKVLVGGGCFTNAYFLQVLASGPSIYEPNGWYCAFANPSGFDVSVAGGINVIASAICAGP
jgi:hypothetical protein